MKLSNVTLYYSPGACSLAPHIALEETKTPYTLKLRDTHQEELMHINPLESVPTLTFDLNGQTHTLTEVPAVLSLISKHSDPNKGLYSPEPSTFSEIKMIQMLNFIATEMHKGFAPFFTYKKWITSPENQVSFTHSALEVLKERYDFLEAHLKNSEFLFKEGLSSADFYLFTILRWTKVSTLNLSAYPNSNRFFETLKSRPSVKAAMTQEGLIK